MHKYVWILTNDAEKDARKKANAKTKVLHAVTRPKSIEFDDDALEAENSPANECHVQRPPQKVNIKQYYDAESEGDSGSENTDGISIILHLCTMEAKLTMSCRQI